MRIKCSMALVPVTIGMVAIFLFSCSRNYVALEYTNAKGEVPQLENLVFRFNKPLIPDSLINMWDSTDYISFTPSIPGKFRWNTPEELVFSPAQPLLPATSYSAKIGNQVLHFSNYNNVKEADKIEFHTALLQLTDAQVTWITPDDNSKTPVPQVNIEFNYPVSVDDLKEKMSIDIEGNKSDYTIQNVGVSNQINIRLTSLKVEDRNYEAKIQIDKGLKPDKGEKSTEDILKTTLAIPSPYVLNINNVETEHDGEEGIVRIFTSQQLNSEDVSKYIKFTPSVNYTVELTDMGIELRSEKFDPTTSYSFVVSKGLRGKIGGILKEDYTGNAVFGELASEIKFPNNKAVYLSKNGGGNIEVRITSTPKMKLVISKFMKVIY